MDKHNAWLFSLGNRQAEIRRNCETTEDANCAFMQALVLFQLGIREKSPAEIKGVPTSVLDGRVRPALEQILGTSDGFGLPSVELQSQSPDLQSLLAKPRLTAQEMKAIVESCGEFDISKCASWETFLNCMLVSHFDSLPDCSEFWFSRFEFCTLANPKLRLSEQAQALLLAYLPSIDRRPKVRLIDKHGPLPILRLEDAVESKNLPVARQYIALIPDASVLAAWLIDLGYSYDEIKGLGVNPSDETIADCGPASMVLRHFRDRISPAVIQSFACRGPPFALAIEKA